MTDSTEELKKAQKNQKDTGSARLGLNLKLGQQRTYAKRQVKSSCN